MTPGNVVSLLGTVVITISVIHINTGRVLPGLIIVVADVVDGAVAGFLVASITHGGWQVAGYAQHDRLCGSGCGDSADLFEAPTEGPAGLTDMSVSRVLGPR